ncbi:MAG: hypothetical protein WC915_05410 [archaeon]|jgi:hypothetical protein
MIVTKLFAALTVTLVTSVVLIILGIIYFGVTLVIINAAAGLVFTSNLDVNWAVFSAAILATGAILAGAIEKKM